MRTATINEFTPPPTRGLAAALGLALAVHAGLLVLLALGVQWKHDIAPVSVEAELWSALPVQAAPPPQPPLPPLPQPVVETSPPTPPVDPAIATARARLAQEQQRERQTALAREARERDKRARQTQEKKQQEQLRQAAQEQAKREAQRLTDLRRQQMERMARLAGQAGASGESGSASKASGPSAGYAGRIRARIKPNIVYVETINANPAAEVEVRTAPQGTILSRKLVKSSGIASWDEAVLLAIDKTESLPRDVDGQVPPVLTLVFRPRD